MFFDSVQDIKRIASQNGTAIFVIPKDTEVNIDKALILEPEEKTVITIEQVRKMLGRLSMRQANDVYIIIRPAEQLGDESANAFLKSLEEPNDKVHYILITDSLYSILPTIVSRAAIYFLRQSYDVNGAVEGEPRMIELARKFVVAKPSDLPLLAEQVTKKKDGVRAYALTLLETSIEILYKSYFKTKREVFLKKLPKFIDAYDAIYKNGHIKLHLIADLL